MKLLTCKACKDVINLLPGEENRRYCLCKKSSGYTKTEHKIAVYSGPSVPLSINYYDLKEAVASRAYFGLGTPFNAWIIPFKNRAALREDNEG